jgi:hypothetical protein
MIHLVSQQTLFNLCRGDLVEQINSRRAEQEMALELHILQLNSTPTLLQFLALEEHKSEMANIFEGMMAYSTSSTNRRLLEQYLPST